jgi:hypothetical protein
MASADFWGITTFISKSGAALLRSVAADLLAVDRSLRRAKS